MPAYVCKRNAQNIFMIDPYQVDESGVLVEPGPDDARVDGDRLHVAVVLELPLEGAREHDLRRLRVAVRTLGTVELPEIAKSNEPDSFSI